MRLSRPTVIREWSKPSICYADLIVIYTVGQAAGTANTNQVV